MSQLALVGEEPLSRESAIRALKRFAAVDSNKWQIDPNDETYLDSYIQLKVTKKKHSYIFFQWPGWGDKKNIELAAPQ